MIKQHWKLSSSVRSLKVRIFPFTKIKSPWTRADNSAKITTSALHRIQWNTKAYTLGTQIFHSKKKNPVGSITRDKIKPEKIHRVTFLHIIGIPKINPSAIPQTILTVRKETSPHQSYCSRYTWGSNQWFLISSTTAFKIKFLEDDWMSRAKILITNSP